MILPSFISLLEFYPQNFQHAPPNFISSLSFLLILCLYPYFLLLSPFSTWPSHSRILPHPPITIIIWVFIWTWRLNTTDQHVSSSKLMVERQSNWHGAARKWNEEVEWAGAPGGKGKGTDFFIRVGPLLQKPVCVWQYGSWLSKKSNFRKQQERDSGRRNLL